MKKYIGVIMFSLVALTMQGQERVTEYITEESSDKLIFKKVAGEDYVLQITKMDSLIVYKMVDEVPRYLHSRFYGGIGSLSYINSTDSYFLYQNSTGSIAYNFASDSEFHIPYTGESSRTGWRAIYEDQVVLVQDQRVGDIDVKYLVDLNTQSIIPLEHSYLSIAQNDDFLVRANKLWEFEYEIIIHDKIDHSETVIDTSMIFSDDYALSDQQLFYLKGDSLMRYNYISGETELYYNIYDEHTSSKVIIDKSGETVSLLLRLTTTDTKVVRFDTREHNASIYIIDRWLDNMLPEEIDGHLVFTTDGYVFTYNMESDFLRSFDSYTYRVNDLIVLGNQYVVHTGENGLKILDLSNYLESEFSGLSLGDWNTYTGSIQVGDNYHFSILYVEVGFLPYSDANNTFTFDPENKTLQYSSLLPKSSNRGLPLTSRLLNVDATAYVISNKWTSVLNEESLVNLYNQPEYYNQAVYKIINDKMYWLELGEGIARVKTYRDGEVITQGLLNNPEISALTGNAFPYIKFNVVGDDTYFIDPAGDIPTLVRYNSDLNSLQLIDEVNVRQRESFSHQGYLYYFRNQEGMRVLTPELENLKVDVPVASFIYEYDFFLFKDQVLFKSDDAIYHLEGAVAKKVMSLNSLGYQQLKISNDLVTTRTDDGSIEIYDGDKIEIIQQLENYSLTSIVSNRYLFFENPYSTENYQSIIYDLVQQEYIEVPTDLSDQRIMEVLRLNDKNILLTSSPNEGNRVIKIHNVSADLDTIVELFQFECFSYGVDSDFEINQNGGLLYIGDKLIEISNDLTCKELSNFKGNYRNDDIAVIDDWMYFIGFDADLGRQVFKYQIGEPVVIENDDDIKANILLYPNPAGGVINIKSNLKESYAFEIYTSHGHRVMQGDSSETSVYVRQLSKGLYYVRILVDGEHYAAASFVKM